MISARKKILFGALFAFGMAATAIGASASAADPATTPTGHAPHFRGGPMLPMLMDGPFLHAIHQLNLTADQQTAVHGLMDTARQQIKGNAALRPNIDVLANPGDPNYVSALAAAKAAAANAIQQRSDLQVQIFGLLTPEQRAKLPQMLADMKAQHLQHRADWQQKRGPAPSAN